MKRWMMMLGTAVLALGAGQAASAQSAPPPPLLSDLAAPANKAEGTGAETPALPPAEPAQAQPTPAPESQAQPEPQRAPEPSVKGPEEASPKAGELKNEAAVPPQPEVAPAPEPALQAQTPLVSETIKEGDSADDSVRRIMERLIEESPDKTEMSLVTSLEDAYRDNPTLRAARAQVKAVFEQLPQAWSGYQPTIGAAATLEENAVNIEPGNVDNSALEKSAAVTLSQPLYRGGRTVAETAQANAVIDAQLATLADTEQQVLLLAAQAYMDVLRDQALVRVNENNREVIARQLKATQDRFRVGDVTRTDVSQSEFRLASAQADVTTSIANLNTARAAFTQIVGSAPERLRLPQISFELPTSVDAAADMAETYNPVVIRAQALHVAAEKGVDAAFGNLLPEVSLTSALSRANDPSGGAYDEQNAASIGVTASIPLYEAGSVRSQVREAKYTANQRYIQIMEARRAAREQAVRAWETLKAAKGELTSRQAQVRAAEIARAGVRQEAELGERTILDALDADQEVRDAQVALISAKRNEVVATFSLLSALGVLTPGTVGIKDFVFDTDSYRRTMEGRIFSLGIDAEPESGR